MATIRSRTLCLCAITVVTACSSAKKSFPSFAPVSQMVTPSQGGMVTAGNGAVVTVPAGAVPSNTTITMAPSMSTPPANLNQAGISVQFGPGGTQFAVPVTVKLPYDPGLIPSGAVTGIWTQEDQPGSPWQFIGGEAAGSGFFQTKTTHFSSCVVGSGPPGGGGGSGGGGSGGSGGGSDGSTGGNCNSNALGGPTVAEQQIASAGPAPQGGSVQNGTYYLTATTRYTGTGGATGPSGNTRQATVVITNASSTGFTAAIAELKNGTTTNRMNITATLSGTSFTQAITCTDNSNSGGGTAGYTATATTFVVFDNGSGGGMPKQQTFTLQ